MTWERSGSDRPRPEDVQSALAGGASPEAIRTLVEQLLASGGELPLLAGLARWRQLEASGSLHTMGDAQREAETMNKTSLDRAVQRARDLEVTLAAERSEARRELHWFLTLSAEEQAEELRAPRPSLCTYSFVEGLTTESYRLGPESAGRAVRLARFAAEVAGRLDAGAYGASLLADLQSTVYTHLGTVLRIQGEWRLAEDAFARASTFLQQGTGDPVNAARLSLCEASLFGSQGQMEKCRHLLDRTTALARRVGDCHLEGSALLMRVFFEHGEVELDQVLAMLRTGLKLIDQDREPRLVIIAWHNLVLTLADLGHYTEARRLLPQVRELHAAHGGRLDHLRLRWLEARIAGGLGEGERAEVELRAVEHQLIEEGLAYDAALVSLDLAMIYARQGRTGEMRQLAAEMLPIFESRDVHRAALAALLVFQKAAEMDAATVGLVEEVQGYLRRARHNPALHFEPSA
jgi:tetratricopeptide (TPR) repeat protein